MAQDGAAAGAAAYGVIAIDWGSTRMRSWLIEGDGRILAHRCCEDGAIGLAPEQFDRILAREVGDWAAARPRAPMLACGMVGARGAWKEAPYVDLPAGLDAIRAHRVTVNTSLGRPLQIVGGLRTGEPDVLRGEETQALGVGIADGLLCMPGTHSKWLRIRAGTIDAFATWFTGELYDLLGSHGSLGKAFGPSGRLDPGAFDDGVARALTEPGRTAWLHALFGFRARVVGQGVDGALERARLSGWLIGTELMQALSALGGHEPLPPALVLVADPQLGAFYERALGIVRPTLAADWARGLPERFRHADPQCAANGLYRIATGS